MALTWPATLEQLEEAGYGYTGTAKTCSCGTQILWFITPATPEKPRGKWMPFSALKDSRLVPHHAVCQRVKEFRAALIDAAGQDISWDELGERIGKSAASSTFERYVAQLRSAEIIEYAGAKRAKAAPWLFLN